jgi:hypothetical protein
MYSPYYNFNRYGLYPFLGSLLINWGKETHDANFQFDKFGDIDTVELTITAIGEEGPTWQDLYLGNNGILSCNFLVVSEKVKNILEKFTISEHRFYPAKLKSMSGNSRKEGYYALQILYNPLKDFDFKESIFESYPVEMSFSKNKKLITYEKGYVNKDNYLQLRTESSKDYRGLSPILLKFNKKYNITCDAHGIWFDKEVLKKLIEAKIFEDNTIHYFCNINGHSVGGLTYKEAGWMENRTDDILILKPHENEFETREKKECLAFAKSIENT